MVREVWSALSAAVVVRAASQLSRDAVIDDFFSETDTSGSDDDDETMETTEELQSAQSKVEKELALGTVLLQPDQPASPKTVAVNLSVLPSDQRPSAEVEMSQLVEPNKSRPPADSNDDERQETSTEPMQGVELGPGDLDVLVKLPSGSMLPFRASSCALLRDWKHRILSHCGLHGAAEANFGLALGFAVLDEGRSAISNDLSVGDVITLFERSL